MIENEVLAHIITALRMRMYSQNYQIIIKTNYPIMKIPAKPDLAKQIIRCALDKSSTNQGGKSNPKP